MPIIDIYSPDQTHLHALCAYARRHWPDAAITPREDTAYRVDSDDADITDRLDARSLYWDQIDPAEMEALAEGWAT